MVPPDMGRIALIELWEFSVMKRRPLTPLLTSRRRDLSGGLIIMASHQAAVPFRSLPSGGPQFRPGRDDPFILAYDTSRSAAERFSAVGGRPPPRAGHLDRPEIRFGQVESIRE